MFFEIANLWLSDVFRGYGKGTVARNRLIKLEGYGGDGDCGAGRKETIITSYSQFYVMHL